MGISAKVICDSVSPNGERLTTMEVEFHRFILPELNTHRVFSRNYQSSRAVPIEKMIEQVRTNPAMPVHWGKNQRGMQAEKEFTGQERQVAIEHWVKSAHKAAKEAEYLFLWGAHKQLVNRILEPYMWTKGVITASGEGWQSFFDLRIHKDAQPEIKALAEAIKEAQDKSNPRELRYGEWHLPYVSVGYDALGLYPCTPTGEPIRMVDGIKVSVSCCAQVSYRNLDTSLDKAKKIYGMLNLPKKGRYRVNPAHFSPAEHVAKCVSPTMMDQVDPLQETRFFGTYDGNFGGQEFMQFRKALEHGFEEVIIGSTT